MRIAATIILFGATSVAIVAAVIAGVRANSRQEIRAANEPCEAAVSSGLQAEAQTDALRRLVVGPKRSGDLAEIAAAAQASSHAWADTVVQCATAMDTLEGIYRASDTDAARTYWTLKRGAILKLSEAAAAYRDSLFLLGDDSFADLEAALEAMKPRLQRAAEELAESRRLAAVAKKFRAEHRDQL